MDSQAVLLRGQTEMKYRGKYNIHQLFCCTIWLSCGTVSLLSLVLSFHGIDPTNIVFLRFTFNKISASHDHYQMTLSGPNWIDVCNMKLYTKDPVLHKTAMMDTMSPFTVQHQW